MSRYETREQWLEAAATRLANAFNLRPGGTSLELKLSFGWPKGQRKLVGQCFSPKLSHDETTHHIFVSPKLTERVDILVTVLHEMIHAAVGTEAGHRGPFVKVAKRVGLLKPWTATPPSPELVVKLRELAGELGDLPHVGLNPVPKKQTTRMKLWECACGVKIRRAGDLHAKCLDCGTEFRRRDT